jgi:two-component system nitrate/nitrite sensor histidine kinase NarX
MPSTQGPAPTETTPSPDDSAAAGGGAFAWPLAGIGLIAVAGIGTLLVASRYPDYAVWAVSFQVLLISAALVLIASVWRQIDRLQVWARRMRRGDLSARVRPSSGPFAPLAREINALSDDLDAKQGAENKRADNQKQLVRLAGKTQSLDVLYAIATSLGQPGTLDQLLDSFLDTFIELIDARAASVRVVTEDGYTRLIASRGLDPAVVEQDRLMPLGRCHCGWCATEGGIRVQKGTSACARLVGRPMLERDCQEFVVVPVQHQDRILGVYNLFLDRPLAAMGEDMPDLLISVGRHLGLALEKARLDNDARRLALMEERTLIGSELHDSLAQALVSMRLQVKMLSESLHRKDSGAAESEVSNLRQALDEAHANLRDLLANFRLKIGDRGFAPAIADMVQRFQQETGIAVFFQNEVRALNLTSAQEVQVFYIIQEALTNIRKHSKARNVRVMLNNEDDFYTVLIEDDGLGMAEVVQGIAGERMGLAIMRERTERLPGQLVIESEPEEGTRIVLMFTAPPPPARGHPPRS